MGHKTTTYYSHFKIDPKARERMREEIGIAKDDIVIGYAGALARSEGVPILLQAVKALTKSHTNIRLLVLGAKVLHTHGDNIPQLIEDLDLKNTVILHPPVPHVEVPSFLSA
ncbi:glycosyltransferase, partial [Chloroflexota bacterium]